MCFCQCGESQMRDSMEASSALMLIVEGSDGSDMINSAPVYAMCFSIQKGSSLRNQEGIRSDEEVPWMSGKYDTQ